MAPEGESKETTPSAPARQPPKAQLVRGGVQAGCRGLQLDRPAQLGPGLGAGPHARAGQHTLQESRAPAGWMVGSTGSWMASCVAAMAAVARSEKHGRDLPGDPRTRLSGRSLRQRRGWPGVTRPRQRTA